MTFARSLLIAALIAPALSCSQPFIGDTGIRRFGFDLWDVRCPSGLRVLLEKDVAAGVVGVVTVVGVGSTEDPPGKEGLAHFVEHLAFRARHHDGPSVWGRLDRLGATDVNAFTTTEATTYHEFAAQQRLPALMQLESDRFTNPLEGVDEATFAVEREVVRNELRQRNETGFVGQALNWIQEAVFPAGHPYHRGGAGSHESLSAITLDDARAFVARHYRPENMTMLLIGDVPLGEAEAYVKAHLPPALYGDPAKPAPRIAARVPSPAPPVPQVKPAGLTRHQAAVHNPEVWVAWAVPGGFGRDKFISAFWASLVDGNFGQGRFADDPDIVDVSFFPWDGPQAGMLIGRITLTEGTHPQESIDRVLKYLPWIDDEMWLGRRFLRLKATALRRQAFAAETVRGRAELRASYLHFTGQPGYFGSVMDTITSIEAGDAVAFAQKYLGREQAHAVFIEPLGPEQQQPPGTTGLGEGRAEEAAAPEHMASDPKNDTPVGHRRLDGLRTVRLPNGLTLILARRTTMPIVSINLGFHGGVLSSEPAAVAEAAKRAVELNLEESPSDYGIGFSTGYGNDQLTATLQAGIDNLPRALDMLAFSLKSFDVEWPSDRFRASTLPFLRRFEAEPHQRAWRDTVRVLYGKHPMADQPLADEIDRVAPAAIKSWYRAQRSPQNGALVIVGDIDLDRTEAMARDALGGWSGPSDAKVTPPPPLLQASAQPSGGALVAAGGPIATPDYKAIIVHDKAHATQVELSLNCLLPANNERRDAVDDVLALLTGRLHHRIRDQAGASYGVHTSAWNIRGGSAGMNISTDIDNAHFGQALTTVRRFMTDWAANGFSASDITWARFQLNSGHLFTAQSVGGLASALLRDWNMGWPLDAVDRYPDYLAAVTAEDVLADMRACAANQVLTMVGNRRAIEAGLRQAGISPAPAAVPTKP